MAIGRISGQMLYNDLERSGSNLTFDGNLLHLDVNNRRVGVNNTNPLYELDVDGTVRANTYIGTTLSTTGNVTAGNIVVSGAVIAGNTTVNSINSNGSVTGTTGTFSGNVLAGNLYTVNVNASGSTSTNSLVITTSAVIGSNLTVSGDTALNGNLLVSDMKFYLLDNVDTTKKAQFQISGITPGTTRTYTLPDNSSTLVDLATAQTITAVKTFSATTQNIGSSTANSTINLGYGATLSGQSKTVLLGTSGVSGSYSQIHIGSNVAGANGNTTINYYTNFSNSVSIAGSISGSGLATFSGGVQNTPIGNATANTGSFTTLTSSGVTTITNTTGSTGTTSGALVVSGGVGIGENLNVNGVINTSSIIVNGGDLTNVNIGNITFSNTTISTKLVDGNITIRPTGNGLVYISSTGALVVPTGTTAQGPVNPPVGALRFNIDTDVLEFYNGTNWISTTPVIDGQTITPDGVSTTFGLIRSTTSAGILVLLNGVMQRPSVSYTVSGNQIIFSEIPLSTDIIDVRYISAGEVLSADIIASPAMITIDGGVSTIDSFSVSDYRSAKYIVQVSDTANAQYQSSEILLTHNDTTPAIWVYGTVYTSNNLVEFTASISSGKVNLQANSIGVNCVVKIQKTYITI